MWLAVPPLPSASGAIVMFLALALAYLVLLAAVFQTVVACLVPVSM